MQSISTIATNAVCAKPLYFVFCTCLLYTSSTSAVRTSNALKFTTAQSTTSVSYTHLDVYKRQVITNLTHNKVTIRSAWSLAIEHKRILALIGTAWVITEDIPITCLNSCLLYTSAKSLPLRVKSKRCSTGWAVIIDCTHLLPYPS